LGLNLWEGESSSCTPRARTEKKFGPNLGGLVSVSREGQNLSFYGAGECGVIS